MLGRLKIMDQIKQDAQAALAQDGTKERPGQLGRGIELVDVGLSRIEFVPEVRQAAFERAVSLMEAIATKTTSEGEQRKKEIINKTQAEVQKIEGAGQAGGQHPQGEGRRRHHRCLRQGHPRNRRVLYLRPHPRGLQGGPEGRHPADPHDRQLSLADDQEARPGQAGDEIGLRGVIVVLRTHRPVDAVASELIVGAKS